MEKRLAAAQTCTVSAIVKLVQFYGRLDPRYLYNLHPELLEDGFQLRAEPFLFSSRMLSDAPTVGDHAENDRQG
jgi:hypothetical protein